MRLKIKVKPEDFIVEEIAELPLVKNGGHAVYLLKKKGWGTLELLQKLSRELKIPLKDFSHGARKDRHALTSQYISIKGRSDIKLNEDDYSLAFIGCMNRPMGPDLIKENKFEVVVRELTDEKIDAVKAEMENPQRWGCPNYFDDQRFGSFDSHQGFLAQKLLKQEFNGALKIYLTSVFPEDRKSERERKEFFFANWKNWELCLKEAITDLEKKAFSFLCRQPKDFLELLMEIPRYELAGFISSYQSFLWNEILRGVIKNVISAPLKSYRGAAGEYLFYDDLDEKNYLYLKDLNIPMPGPKPEFANELIKTLYAQVLEEDGIKNSMFNNLKLRQAFFKSFLRQAIVTPQGLTFAVSEDDFYHGKKKLTLSFSLPRGNYATMFVKRLFC